MIRRSRAYGTFMAPPPLSGVPLLERAFAKHRRPKSERHVLGWDTRRAPIRAKLAELRAELGMGA